MGRAGTENVTPWSYRTRKTYDIYALMGSLENAFIRIRCILCIMENRDIFGISIGLKISISTSPSAASKSASPPSSTPADNLTRFLDSPLWVSSEERLPGIKNELRVPSKDTFVLFCKTEGKVCAMMMEATRRARSWKQVTVIADRQNHAATE
jgi:hypothetical protein